jgi:acyl carrier protein
MNVTQDEIIAIIDAAGVAADISGIKGSSTLKDAGIDSLEVMNVFLGIEEKYGIKIPDEDVDALNTIDSIVAYLQKL